MSFALEAALRDNTGGPNDYSFRSYVTEAVSEADATASFAKAVKQFVARKICVRPWPPSSLQRVVVWLWREADFKGGFKNNGPIGSFTSQTALDACAGFEAAAGMPVNSAGESQLGFLGGTT